MFYQLLASKHGEMVVDFCADVDGRALAIGMAMRSTGRLYVFDIPEKCLSNLGPRLVRDGLPNIHPSHVDSEHNARVKHLMDKIDHALVDASCNGLGTSHRNPDLRWRQLARTVREMPTKWLSILISVVRLLKADGCLVYVTRNVPARENQQVAE